jgi:protein phosphatase
MKHRSELDNSPRTFRVEVGQASHPGKIRTSNEDNLVTVQLNLEGASASTSIGLYAVADGAGGHEAGEIASDMALRVLSKSLVASLLLPELKADQPVLDHQSVLQRLSEAVKAANSAIYALGQAQGNGMGTTLAAVLILSGTAYVANVGDSRVYLLDGKQLRQITTDHSLVSELVTAGEITPEEIYTHPRRNIITRCLGTQAVIEVDVFEEELQSDTSFLLCSDGLWEMVRDNKISDTLLKAKSPQAACDQMVEIANQNGGIDNISVILLRVTQ